MVVRRVRVEAGQSLSAAFESSGKCIVGVLTPSALTALTAKLHFLAAVDRGATPVAAVSSSGTQVAIAVNPSASQYVSVVGEDMIAAPFLRIQTVDATGTAKVQTSAVVFSVVLRRYLS